MINRSKKRTVVLLVCMIMMLPGFAQRQAFRYQPDWESIRSHYKIPDWFRDAKFGIFLHWGPYAVPAYSSEKYPKGIYDKKWQKGGMRPYDYHRKYYGDPSKIGYKDLIPDFKAEKFNADHWAQVFQDAGARYVVQVAEHHDGFAMYKSHVTRWNAADMGPHKDVMKMLQQACYDHGLKFGVSSHFALNRIYYNHEDPTWDVNNPEYYDLYWKPVDPNSLPSQEFLNLWWRRTTDIIDNYQPDVLWFDFGLDKPGFEPLHKKILAYYYNSGLEFNKEVVFQDKNMRSASFPDDLIVLDIERGRLDKAADYPWQTDTSVGKISWGYIRDEQYKKSAELIDELVDIVSKNGCLLLNIGPKADGTLPEPAIKILDEMGAWLKQNGEAIYDTRPWKIYGEGPTKVNKGHHSEQQNQEAGPADIRFTQKDGVLYAISLGWPADGAFQITSMAKGNDYDARKIKSVRLVSGDNKISWKQQKDGLAIKVKGEKPCEAAYTFAIEFDKK